MKIVLLLSSIALILGAEVNPPPRSVNVALETSILLDPKELNDNISFVNRVRRYLDKVYEILEPETAEKQFRTDSKPQVPGAQRKFWEFIQEMAERYANRSARWGDFNQVIARRKSKNMRGQKDMKDSPRRTEDIIKGLVNTLMHNPEKINIFINSTLSENMPPLLSFARRMSSYYNADDYKQLNKIIKKFKRYIESNRDTTKIIKKLLHNTIFKKYDNLNESDKAALMTDLNMLSDFVLPKNSVTGTTRRNSQISFEVDKESLTFAALRRSIDEQIRNARGEKKTDTNDFVVGNVELFVEPHQKS